MLVSLQDFKDYVIISENIKLSEIEPHIKIVEESQLASLICKDLYNDLVESKENDCMTAEMVALMAYIVPYVVTASYSRYIAFNGLHGTRQGLVKITGDNAEVAEQERLSNISGIVSNDMQYFAKQITDFLEENEDSYALYNCKPKKVSSFKISAIGYKRDNNILL